MTNRIKLLIIMFLFLGALAAQGQEHFSRNIDQVVFVPKGQWVVGLSANYGQSKFDNYQYLVVENINNPQSIQVFDRNDGLVARYEVPEQVNGYEYEIREAERCVREGRLQSEWMTWEQTVSVMRIMDEVRRQNGMRFPFEK